MMDKAKIVVGSGWIYKKPEEVIDRFCEHEQDSQGLISYDEKHHQFVLECPLLQSESASKALRAVIQEYLRNDCSGELSPQDLGEMTSRIVPLQDKFGATTDCNGLWEAVELLENQRVTLPGEKISTPKTKKLWSTTHLIKGPMSIYANGVLDEVEQHSGCRLELDYFSDLIRVTGASSKAVQGAIDLLVLSEKRQMATSHVTSFDFLEDSVNSSVQLRFVRPTSPFDQDVFGQEKSLICELMAVEWCSDSRQWRTVRKEITPITEFLSTTSQRRSLLFRHRRHQNDPNRWLKDILNQSESFSVHGNLTLQQLGRTLKWSSESQNDFNSSPDVASEPADAGQRGEMHDIARRRVLKVMPESLTNHGKEIRLLEDCRGQSSQLSPGHEADSNVSSSADNLPKFIDFNRLQSPRKNTPKRQVLIENIHKLVLEKVSTMKGSSIAFEFLIGRIYVYTLTVPIPELQPQAKTPADAFPFTRWEDIFRTEPNTYGASTKFSPKLTNRQCDAQFILNTKMSKGQRLFDCNPKYVINFFEVHCRDPVTGTEAILEIHDKGDAKFEGVGTTLGCINFHYPSRKWDSRWQVISKHGHFTTEQKSLLQQFLDNAYVTLEEETTNGPELYSRAKVEIVSARLVQETIHRSCRNELRLCLRNINVLEVQRVSKDGVRLFPSRSLKEVDNSASWWEAKLIAPSLQKMMERYTVYGDERSGWSLEDGQFYLRLMLEMSDHIVSRIDSVGSSPGQ